MPACTSRPLLSLLPCLTPVFRQDCVCVCVQRMCHWIRGARYGFFLCSHDDRGWAITLVASQVTILLSHFYLSLIHTHTLLSLTDTSLTHTLPLPSLTDTSTTHTPIYLVGRDSPPLHRLAHAGVWCVCVCVCVVVCVCVCVVT
jgi:hypothetical protein